MIITIDGPVASGKSSVAKALAKKLGFYYLYTGLLYRAAAYVLIERLRKLPASVTPEAVTVLTPADLDFIAQLRYAYADDKPHVFYDDQEITTSLAASSLEQAASLVSAHPSVREALLEFQRALARNHNVIADGRDCGSVVFPNADIKFYLTADVQTRAQRLFTDTSRAHKNTSFEQIKASLIERDERDQNRAIAPLRVPEGAIVIDSSGLAFDQTVERFLQEIKQQQPPHAPAH